MKVRPVLSLILIFGLLPSWGACQTQTAPSAPSQPIQTKPIVTEVTSESVPIEATSASVTVLTRKEIEEFHGVNLAGLLDRVGFIHVAQNGSVGGFASVTIRSGKPNFTLVLLDGAPFNDITNILGVALTSCQLIVIVIAAGASRVAPDPHFICICRRYYPGRFDGNLFARTFQSPSAFPESQAGRVLQRPFRGLHSVHIARLTDLPSRLRDPLHLRLHQLRCLHCCSDYYRVERTSSRVGFSPTVDQRLSRRTEICGLEGLSSSVAAREIVRDAMEYCSWLLEMTELK